VYDHRSLEVRGGSRTAAVTVIAQERQVPRGGADEQEHEPRATDSSRRALPLHTATME